MFPVFYLFKLLNVYIFAYNRTVVCVKKTRITNTSWSCFILLKENKKFFKLYFIALQKRFEKKIKQQQQKQRLMAPIITGESKTLKKKETLLNAIVCGEGCETI